VALVPPPRAHQVRYRGCLAAHSKLRGALTPTPRQQGIEAADRPTSSRLGWARLLQRLFSLDMERCPRGESGALRIIATLIYRPIIRRRRLTPLKLAAYPPPIAPVRLEQGRFAWASADPTRGARVGGPKQARCARST